jgi:biopolymer transport protein ExbD
MAFRSTAANPTIAEMNITPLVDVMLVLLVIFMIASPVLAHRVDLDLAKDDRDTKVEPPRIALVVAADGTLSWNGQPMPDVALGPQLRIEAAKSPQPVVVLDAHDAARYERVAGVLATARNAGIRGVGFDEAR